MGSKNVQVASKRLLGAEERNFLGVPRKPEKNTRRDPMRQPPESARDDQVNAGKGGGGPLKDPQKRDANMHCSTHLVPEARWRIFVTTEDGIIEARVSHRKSSQQHTQAGPKKYITNYK